MTGQTQLHSAGTGHHGALASLHRAMLLLASLFTLTTVLVGYGLFDNLQLPRSDGSSHPDLFAATALVLLGVGAAPGPSASLIWRCIALCAAGLAVMATLGHFADRFFAFSQLASETATHGRTPGTDPVTSEFASPIGIVLLAVGEGLLLCRLPSARTTLVAAALWSCLPLVGFGFGFAGFRTVSSLLLSLGGLSIAAAALASTVNRKSPGTGNAALAAQAARPEAGYDLLTGLLTRDHFDRLVASQTAAPSAAMMLIDIDRFRAANHVLGNKAGDDILIDIARRLTNLAAPHPVARTGSDEFAIFCRPIVEDAAQALSQRIVAAMARPFALADGRHFYLTASVGLAHSATEGVGDLRDAADEAVFIAKNQGGNQALSFLRTQHDARIERIGLEQDLYTAFRNDDELFLVYQPIISLRDQSVIAIEALARWQHPTAGLVPPARFVGIAEAAGLFSGLGAKIRELAVQQVAAWRDSGITNLPIVNLNISPLELSRSDVPGTLSALVDRHGLPRSIFCLEVTEGTFADEDASRSLQAARDAGFLVAMDDFGVGYSSLAQLPKLPLTSLKLDRGFLNLARDNDDGISLFATIVQLAHVLKLPVVAEGVETSAELAVAADCGVDCVQGYFFSRPLSPAQIELSLRRSGEDGGQIRLISPPLLPDEERSQTMARSDGLAVSCTS
ncbi:putative bifunctional diguanylate cyclase/phosphodiesterase [Acidisoma silvae]|uniref:Bifunctional diguanylate cyclase/phosphodiesterase n=1 Tax=Acidisoma silvae TaxID=2802396 RepID=A0A964DXK9_9PROT|nr:bifunctional diguanylate cyclase/phosphodiesterase [Acidisoma silvae]MCB8874395.1 bifunctional diguanylate cyclase/phosphodiesterase [Acidisoma silvae]